MSCHESYIEKYELFSNIDEYMKYDGLAGKSDITESYNVDCNFINEYYGQSDDGVYIPKLIDMCKKFVYLVESIHDKYQENVPYNDYDIDYLNYWINNQLTIIVPDKICKKPFYQNMLSKNSTNLKLRKLSGKILDIEENELKDMNILYTLYKYFKEIKEIINNGNSNKEDIIDYANKCVEEYKKFKQKCTEYQTNFCKTLKTFKDKYEEIDLCKYSLKEWTKNKLPSLTGEDDILVKICSSSQKAIKEKLAHEHSEMSEDLQISPNIHVKSITIGVVATTGISLILSILYKFTSFGQFLRYRMNKNESVWENMNEEMNRSTHTSEYEHINSGNAFYNISFNSV
ncbi:PIR Superfamily Protein [Plasmodium ovale wallikeri]|uniref:PIR Superfamily Protein n=2 Tax=Plasmodium ovale TaxID=36330 RepID=A0A1A9A8K8_PLAOA|nr:PIR Superfamily Protein [Plasmodium ovale wallikeri]SBT59254.1 PIR Superfamily Protein [Plasmodium ovale wallikeri]SBT73084.1 PIR protein [Plasmodium ovale]